MASNHTSLDAAATERKARLAKLKSLKRKQSDSDHEAVVTSQSETPSIAETYLSGRNYDPTTRGPKLGFENAPSENQETLENRAREIAEATAKEAQEEERVEKPIDLFKLQPKKPNWDLKRDLDRKLERLNIQTDNAIARLVRERIEGQKWAKESKGNGKDLEVVGLKGEELLQSVHVREEEDRKEGREEDQDDEA